MTKLIRYSLGLMFTFFGIMSFFMIFIPEAILVFPGSNWTSEQMSEWRLRTILPAFYLTICYFIYRYFSGRNPTSTVWPILIVIFFFMITQIISLFNNYFSWVQLLSLFLTILVFLLLREAHNRRKNEIFNKPL
tara:strand:+ start:906 stop:1307 length:402 start_codon:yes stop_codon:yes gene_type:complete